MSTPRPVAETTSMRHLAVWQWIVLVVGYLVVIQGLGLVLTSGLDAKYGAITSLDILWRSITVPVAVSLVYVLTIVAWLRWWRPVYVDDQPVQRWLVVVPIAMVVSILVVTNYGGLANRGLGFTLLLLLSTQLVGFAEEAMFRGLGVTVFRSNGFTEGRVALWSTVVFGIAHASNLITEGPAAFVQVLATVVAGYFFYLIRRRSGGLVVPSIIHGLWDFSLLSGQVVPGSAYPLGIVSIVVMLVLAVVLLVRRRHISPA